MNARSNDSSKHGQQSGISRARTATMQLLLALWVTIVSGSAIGCQRLGKPKFEGPKVITGGEKITSLKAGDPAPEDGFFVPPRVMKELGGNPAEEYRK